MAVAGDAQLEAFIGPESRIRKPSPQMRATRHFWLRGDYKMQVKGFTVWEDRHLNKTMMQQYLIWVQPTMIQLPHKRLELTELDAALHTLSFYNKLGWYWRFRSPTVTGAVYKPTKVPNAVRYAEHNLGEILLALSAAAIQTCLIAEANPECAPQPSQGQRVNSDEPIDMVINEMKRLADPRTGQPIPSDDRMNGAFRLWGIDINTLPSIGHAPETKYWIIGPQSVRIATLAGEVFRAPALQTTDGFGPHGSEEALELREWEF